MTGGVDKFKSEATHPSTICNEVFSSHMISIWSCQVCLLNQLTENLKNGVCFLLMNLDIFFSLLLPIWNQTIRVQLKCRLSALIQGFNKHLAINVYELLTVFTLNPWFSRDMKHISKIIIIIIIHRSLNNIIAHWWMFILDTAKVSAFLKVTPVSQMLCFWQFLLPLALCDVMECVYPNRVISDTWY